MLESMSTIKIAIGYDGDAVRTGSMDVRELAPSLLALGDMMQEANNILNEGRGQLTTNVKADFKHGSFDVTLDLVQNAADQISFLIEHAKHWTAADISSFIGLSAGTGASLLKFLKWVKNRKIKSPTILENGNCRIETEGDNDSIEVSPEVLRLAKNRKLRLSLKAVLKPLGSLGFDLFYSRGDAGQIEKVEKKDFPSFDVPELPEEQLTDQTREVAVKLIGISFEEGLKWKLADGENRINASVRDGNFQKEIDAGKKFSKSGILVVQLRTRQVITTDGIKNEHEILRVVKHIPAEKQGELQLENN